MRDRDRKMENIRILLWTPDIVFNIDLWIIKLVKKIIYFLVENFSSSLNGLNQPY